VLQTDSAGDQHFLEHSATVDVQTLPPAEYALAAPMDVADKEWFVPFGAASRACLLFELAWIEISPQTKFT
jgi:hypothetical protein